MGVSPRKKSKPLKPKAGYGSPKAERFFVNGFKPIMINNINDLDIVKENEIAVLSSKLGLKSVLEISKRAKAKGVKILNNRRAVKAEKVMLNKKRAKEAVEKDKVKKESSSTKDVEKKEHNETKLVEKQSVHKKTEHKKDLNKHENKPDKIEYAKTKKSYD